MDDNKINKLIEELVDKTDREIIKWKTLPYGNYPNNGTLFKGTKGSITFEVSEDNIQISFIYRQRDHYINIVRKDLRIKDLYQHLVKFYDEKPTEEWAFNRALEELDDNIYVVSS